MLYLHKTFTICVMILNIYVKNFRSFKDEISFSMLAESSKTKEDNVFNYPLYEGKDEIRLLKSAMIYGANASGKSNLLRVLMEITNFIVRDKPNLGQPIPSYDPFKFDINSAKAPTEFFLEFIGTDSIRYKYELVFDNKNIIREELNYWPNRKSVNLFARQIPEKNQQAIIHTGKLGRIFKSSKPIEVFHNQALLSKFGQDTPNDIISAVYIYFSSLEVINAFNTMQSHSMQNEMSEIVLTNPNLLAKINALLRIADTGLNGINVLENTYISSDPSLSPDLKSLINKNHKYTLSGIHSLFNQSKLLSENEQLPFSEESNGTKAIFSLGGKILYAIEKGVTIFVDELETSLHPFLCKLLVSLFQNKKINKLNAQIIFTTHDTNLLDKYLFRKDQIWFAEKNEVGSTTMYSLQDFNDVREDTPFDKWYLAGKFGGIPDLESLETLYAIDEKF